MKLDIIFDRVKEHRAKVDQTKNDIIFLEQRIANAKAQAEDLANNADEEGYIAAMDEIRTLENRLYVKNKIVNSTAPAVTEEELSEAWTEYAADYNKKFQRKYAEYAKARKQLCKIYADMVSDQNQALTLRAKIGEVTGRNSKGLTFDTLPDMVGHPHGGIFIDTREINYSGLRFHDFTTPMMWESGEIQEPDALKWHGVVTLKLPQNL